METNDQPSPSVKKKPRGRPFDKGNGGRKLGARNRTSLLADALLEGEEEELVRKGIELAKAGDPQMLKFFLDRILPKDRPVKIDLPPIEGRSNLAAAYAAIMKAVGAGEVTPSEGSAVAALLANGSKFIDDVEFDARLRKIEEEFNYRQAKS
jgi:hypothetical protein